MTRALKCALLGALQDENVYSGWPIFFSSDQKSTLTEVYDVVREGRVVGRIALDNGPAPSWFWILAYGCHDGRTATRGQEPTRDAAGVRYESGIGNW